MLRLQFGTLRVANDAYLDCHLLLVQVMVTIVVVGLIKSTQPPWNVAESTTTPTTSLSTTTTSISSGAPDAASATPTLLGEAINVQGSEDVAIFVNHEDFHSRLPEVLVGISMAIAGAIFSSHLTVSTRANFLTCWLVGAAFWVSNIHPPLTPLLTLTLFCRPLRSASTVSRFTSSPCFRQGTQSDSDTKPTPLV